jgi:serine/threonine-protein kinase 11
MLISVKPVECEVQYRDRDPLKIVGEYALGMQLGEGSFGKVKEAVNIHSKNRVAIKIYSQRDKKIEGGKISPQKEIEIMKTLRNEHVVQSIEDFVIPEKGKLYVVIEYVNGGSLQDLLNRAPENRLPMKQLRKIFKALISGLIYLQGEGIIHRDIKPDNILLTSEGDVKIGDFGVAIKIDLTNEKSLENFKWREGDTGGSPAFQPPECQQIDYRSIPDADQLGPLVTKRTKIVPLKVDVWSAGVVLYIMVVGKFPFETPNIISLFTNIAKGKFKIPDWVSPELTELLKSILQVDPDNRFSLLQIKKHNWMKMQLKNSSSIVSIDPISSHFGHDNKTLSQVLDDLLTRNADRKLSIDVSENIDHSSTISELLSDEETKSADKRSSRSVKRIFSKKDYHDDHKDEHIKKNYRKSIPHDKLSYRLSTGYVKPSEPTQRSSALIRSSHSTTYRRSSQNKKCSIM